MNQIVEAYLKENIDARASIESWREKNDIPIFLRERYRFYEMTILETSCVLMDILDGKPGVETLIKHIHRIESLTNRPVVLFYKEITRYRKRSLIEKRIPFLIEDGQMYLPFMALHLKRGTDSADVDVKRFSASAQLAYLFFLYNRDKVVNVTEFSEIMGLSQMTASRALNELYRARLLTYEIGGATGRSKKYKRIPDPGYFRKGREYLKSPVKRVVYMKKAPSEALVSGADALAHISMLNPPDYPVRAIGKNSSGRIEPEIITNPDLINDLQPARIEIWDYDPKLFSEKDHVDLLSLYLSLRDEKDERIEQALRDVLRAQPWYTD
ncbi:MAG: MarR family transcriptional regulator [Clostridiales bacterium]|nr:MarR family transcriptional regulator [Clostridiales bacterium]